MSAVIDKQRIHSFHTLRDSVQYYLITVIWPKKAMPYTQFQHFMG